MAMHTTLVIAAHPDDEALGAGGAIARWSAEGHAVHLAFLADGIGARNPATAEANEELRQRRAAAKSAADILGAASVHFDDLPDNKLDTVPLLQITQRVEALIHKLRPERVVTHHIGDLNIDHRRVHQAVLTACRPQPGHPVRELLFFEVASSTEWQPPGSGAAFQPNVFIDISETLDRKLAALQAYAQEMRAWPHSRSIEAVGHLARWRGATVGVPAAEAFVLGRSIR